MKGVVAYKEIPNTVRLKHIVGNRYNEDAINVIEVYDNVSYDKFYDIQYLTFKQQS